MGRFVDKTGKRYGRLLVVSRSDDLIGNDGKRYVMWKCVCDCGNVTYVRSSNLGVNTTSCGCFLKEVAGKQTIKHGIGHSRIYSIYNGMKQRCNNPKSKFYKNYGGRGVKVCDEWNKPDGLKSFHDWAIKNGYMDNLTIERKDVNGDYSPENCEWVPLSEQFKNTTRNVFVVYEGKRMIISDFSRVTGIDHRIVSRDLKNGLSIDEIIERRKH